MSRQVLLTALVLGLVSYSAHAVVTSDETGSHVTTPGQPAFGVNLDGVSLLAGEPFAGASTIDELIFPFCTAALISDRHILTAAHCFDDDADGITDSGFVFPHAAAFELPDRTVMLSINSNEGELPSVLLPAAWPELEADVRVSKFRDFILDATGGATLFVPDGDFDHDGQLTPTDIDILSTEALGTKYEEDFDLDLDGLVNQEDRRIWVEELAGTFFGDANLNQTVQLDDFVVLADGFAAEGGWAVGDFDGDRIVQFPDLVLLAGNFGKSAFGAIVVKAPEPSGFSLTFIAGLAFIRRLTSRRQREAQLDCSRAGLRTTNMWRDSVRASG